MTMLILKIVVGLVIVAVVGGIIWAVFARGRRNSHVRAQFKQAINRTKQHICIALAEGALSRADIADVLAAEDEPRLIDAALLELEDEGTITSVPDSDSSLVVYTLAA
ncbi:MAG TPA: hypothetical protein VLF67_04665 [Candidatus Saccharimonas sp.]|nr:hypothetical protein [Candidatus Saccharimonas sp.]